MSPLADPTKLPGSSSLAWHCCECGRMEDNSSRACPDCGEKRQRVSRFEWFLADAIARDLKTRGVQFKITEQYEVPDHRGFSWYFDLAVHVKGANFQGGHTELIEVNGADHARQREYSGPGGGYTRDYDKHWEAFNNLRLHKRGFDLRTVSNEDCRLRVVQETAHEITDEIVRRAEFGS